jgi:hypothetical protein
MRLTEETAKRNDHRATIGYAQRIIDLEPTEEAAVRIQMEAISHLATEPRRCALTIALRRCSSASLRRHPARRSELQLPF